MDLRIKEIANILINTPYNPSHQKLIDEGKILLTDLKLTPIIAKVMFESQQIFLVCSTLIIKSLQKSYLMFPLNLSQLAFLNDFKLKANYRSKTYPHFQSNYLKPLFEEFVKFWVLTDNSRIQNILLDLGSLFLNIIMMGSKTLQNLIWFNEICFPRQQDGNQFSERSQKIILFGFSTLKQYIQQTTVFGKSGADKKYIEFFQDQILSKIVYLMVQHFQYFMRVKKQRGCTNLQEFILEKIIVLINKCFNYDSCTNQNHPQYFNLLIKQTIAEDIGLICQPLAQNPQCSQQQQTTVAQLTKTIYNMFAFHIVKQSTHNFNVSLIIEPLSKNMNIIHEKPAYFIMHTALKYIQTNSSKTVTVNSEIKNGSFDNTLDLAYRTISYSPLDPYSLNIPLAFKLIRAAQNLIDPNTYPKTLKLTLIFLQRVATSSPNTNSGFAPKQELDLTVQWIHAVMQDVSLTHYPSILQFILRVDPFKIPASSIMTWMVCVSTILFNRKKNRQLVSKEQVQCIKVYLQLIASFNKIQSLFFAHQLLKYCLDDIDQGVPSGLLWPQLKQIFNISYFYVFLTQMLNKLFQVFMEECIQTVDYTLEILLQTYKRINQLRYDLHEQNAQKYFEVYKNFLLKVNSSIFSIKQYYSKRVDLLKIISITQLQQVSRKKCNKSKPVTIYRQFVCNNLTSNPSIENFEMMMYDAAGLISTLNNKQSINLLIDYLLDDIDVFYEKYIIPFSNQEYSASAMLALLKLFNSILVLEEQQLSQMLKFKIHKYLSIVISYYIKPNFSKKTYSLFKGYAKLNLRTSLEYFPPLPNQYIKLGLNTTIDRKISQQFYEIVEIYFDTIGRVKDILPLFQYVTKSVDYLYKWYVQAKKRQIKIDSTFVDIVNQRVYTENLQQSEKIARIIYRQGLHLQFQQYDPLKNVNGQNKFVKKFQRMFPPI